MNVRALYTAALYLLAPLVLLRLLWRSLRSPGYRQRMGERFAVQRTPLPVDGIWIHAVSVGETQAAALLVERLRLLCPGVPLIITTATPTGSERVRALFGDTVHHVYAPYDLPRAVARFLEEARPQVVVVMETELWPNLTHQCHLRGIPLLVANARLSARSAAGYRRVGALTRSMLAEVTLIAAQAREDAQRFIELGAAPDRVRVTGSVKFDIRLPASLQEAGEALRREWGVERPVWIAASTHEGEEEQVLLAAQTVLRLQPRALLVLVPRHPERFDRAAALCERLELVTARRSLGEAVEPETEVYLGDTMGELNLLYAAADVAFVGGSLIPVGGHNMLEPAARGMPILFGPHVFNFDRISRLLLDAHAARQVTDAGELAARVSEWLRDANARHQAGEQGRAVVAANRGAVDAQLQMILGFVERRPAAGG